MSWTIENTKDEIEDLVGATIEDAWIEEPSDESDGYDMSMIRIRVKYRNGLRINASDRGEYELWQDEEGNGPGFLAYHGPPKGES